MIIVKGRELLIPEHERYIGTNYDAGMENRVFRIPRLSQSGTDLSVLKFNVNLIFNSEPLDIAELQKTVDDDYIYLTWTVTAAQVAVTGTVFVCVTGNDTNDTVKWSTFMAPFYTEKSLGEDVEAEYKKVIAKVNKEIEDREAADTAERTAREAADAAEKTARETADASLQSAISAEASTRAAQDTLLQNQINQIVAPSGSAPSAAEVQNARIGVDGTTYDTLGNAIRGQISGVSASIDKICEALIDTNHLPPESVRAGYSVTVSSGKAYAYANSGSNYAIYNLKNLEGHITVNASKASAVPFAYVLTDDNQNIISTAANNTDIELPVTGATQLWVNYTGTADVLLRKYAEPDALDSIIDRVVPFKTGTYENYYISYSQNGNISGGAVSGNNVNVYLIKNSIGKRLHISVEKSTLPVFAIISNESGQAIAILKTEDESVTDYTITIPNGAARVYVNYTDSVNVWVQDYYDFEHYDKEIVRLLEVPDVYVSYGAGGTSGTNVSGTTYRIYDVSNLIGERLKITTELLSTSYPIMCFFLSADLRTVSASVIDNTATAYVDYEITVPQNTLYLYLNCRTSVVPVVKYEKTLTLEKVPRLKDERLDGKRLVCFGTSITWYNGHAYNIGYEQGRFAVGYPHYFEEAGMIVNNQGYDGANIRNIVNEKVLPFDFSTYDYATFGCGANDSRNGIPVGEIQENNFDQTFIGRLQAAIEHMLTSNPHIKILLLTPIRGWIFAPDGYTYPRETDGVVEEEYATAIKQVAAHYALPVCDLYNNCGINIFTREYLMNDPETTNLYILHPSNEGFKRMAQLIMPCLRDI